MRILRNTNGPNYIFVNILLVLLNLFEKFSYGTHSSNITKLGWLDSLSSLLFNKNNLNF